MGSRSKQPDYNPDFKPKKRKHQKCALCGNGGHSRAKGGIDPKRDRSKKE